VRHTDRWPLDADAMPPETPFLLQRAAQAEGATLQLLASPGLQEKLAALVGRADRVRSQDTAAGSYRARFVQRNFDVTGARRVEVPTGVDRPLPAVLWTDGDRPADWLRAGRCSA